MPAWYKVRDGLAHCLRGSNRSRHHYFWATIRKISWRISLEIFFLPITRRALEEFIEPASRGLGRLRFRTASCWPETRFSSKRLRRVWKNQKSRRARVRLGTVAGCLWIAMIKLLISSGGHNSCNWLVRRVSVLSNCPLIGSRGTRFLPGWLAGGG
jgi:hypothetical protein